MRTNNHASLFLAGYLRTGAYAYQPDPTAFGFQTLVFADEHQHYLQCSNIRGNVETFMPIPYPEPGTLVTLLGTRSQSIGLPLLSGLVADSEKPSAITILPWLDMARFILNSYEHLIPALRANPLAACQIKVFMTQEVPRNAAATGREQQLRLGDHIFELDDLTFIADQHTRKSSYLRELMQSARIDMES
jgi:hypothetical protein